MTVARRELLAGAAAAAAASVVGLPEALLRGGSAAAQTLGEQIPFSRGRLLNIAQALAAEPYVDHRDEVPEALRNMSYDDYRSMRPGEGSPHPLSDGGRFYYDALLAGFIFNQPVDLWFVRGETAYRITFDRNAYRFDPPSDTLVPPEGPIPFSGFRLRAPYNRPDAIDEFAAFQGASYFRAVGSGETYGLSARGLAINTGAPEGEEFPVFRAFYIEEPSPDANAVVVHALLDSPSTTGAYRFTIRPGDVTLTDVELTLFPRTDINIIGFAPFSSMFLFDSINRADFNDYREAVHDTDGLSIHTGAGDWLWRPIDNPSELQISAFVDTTPRGFGLVQRKRAFEDYEDAEARYETRPTAWVEPIGDWGTGAVVLFEIPTDRETNDNIVAYWKPDQPVRAGEPFSLTYRIHWDSVAADTHEGPIVAASRRGRNFFDSRDLLVVDFLMRDDNLDDVSVSVEASGGKVLNLTHYRIPKARTIRASFELDDDGQSVIELRMQLMTPHGPPSERWLFRWTP
jgi:glucans biosynthesis protein